MIETPEEYRSFVTREGGVNPFGDPSFILIWGENRTIDQLAFPRPFLNPYFNCWILAFWRPAEEFGPPSEWLEELGPYPSRGTYIPILTFRDRKMQPFMLGSEGLNKRVLEDCIKTARRCWHDRLELRKQAFKDHQESIERAKVQRIEAVIHDAYPAFGTADAISYAGQKNTNPALKQMMEKIERNMEFALDFRRRMPKKTSICQVV